MASIGEFAKFGSEWAGCDRDSFDLDMAAAASLVPRRAARRSRKLLAGTIEKQIIPRLVSAHKTVSLQVIDGGATCNFPTTQEIIEFSRLLLDHDVAIASQYIENMCQEGKSIEMIFLNLFSPAARYLGKLWDEDLCDFADVTVALCRLQQLLRELSAAFEAEAQAAPCFHSALLVAAPGEQHTFGVFILQEFFRRAGWDVHGGSAGTADELLGLVQNGAFSLIGLSVSNEASVGDLSAVVRDIREVASPRIPAIIVGGRFFFEHPECVAEVGADATAKDGRRAVLKVSSLLGTNALG